MSEANAQTDELATPRQGPGDRLQSARISIGLSIEQVAGKMHLSSAILSSLEDNNFEDITAPIFVKGYLRAYSRLVNENEEEIIQQYTRYYMDGDPPISSTSNTLPEINADDKRVKWMTWLIILLMLGLLALWWWNRYQQTPEEVSLDSGDKIESPLDNTRLTPSEVVASDAEKSLQQETRSFEQPLAKASSQSTISAPAEVDEPIVPNDNQHRSVAAAGHSPALVAQTNQPDALAEQQSPQPATTPVPGASPSSVNPGADNKPAAVAAKGLQIKVNADTWASIKDANGKKLLKDLLRAGETINLQGKPPISVFLGNGYGVSMTYNGKKVDLSGKIKPNNTAKIQIGK